MASEVICYNFHCLVLDNYEEYEIIECGIATDDENTSDRNEESGITDNEADDSTFNPESDENEDTDDKSEASINKGEDEMVQFNLPPPGIDEEGLNDHQTGVNEKGDENSNDGENGTQLLSDEEANILTGNRKRRKRKDVDPNVWQRAKNMRLRERGEPYKGCKKDGKLRCDCL